MLEINLNWRNFLIIFAVIFVLGLVIEFLFIPPQRKAEREGHVDPEAIAG